MMRAVLWREAARVAGAGGIATAVWAHAAWLSMFVAIWGRGPGIPLLSGTIYEQTLTVQWMLLAFLLPWAAARAIAIERGDALVWTSALLAVPPSRILRARVAALSIALILVVAAGLPIVVIAQRMSDVSSARVALDQTVVVACGVAVATLVTALQQAIANRAAMWVVATVTTCASVWAFTTGGFSAPVVALTLGFAAIGAAILVGARGDLQLRYLSEEPA
jgi:hypothetical protein